MTQTPTPPANETPCPSPISPDDPAVVEVLERMRRVSPEADPLGAMPGVHPGQVPRHVAIIMDGNGRWAKQRGFPRVFGHRSGAASVRAVVEECGRLGIEALTLYSFSSENWKRPAEEIDALMQLCIAYCDGEREELRSKNIRVRVLGRLAELPEEVRGAIDRLVDATSECTGPTLCLAINYGSRDEIVDAVRALAEDVAAGRMVPADVDEAAITSRLYTAGMRDPDLLIRTAGEMRLSNFLLWQISYAELYVSELCWPDFGAAELREAVRAYASRNRRFGGLDGAG